MLSSRVQQGVIPFRACWRVLAASLSKLACARWLLPNGDWIQDEGIPVNIEVKDDPETEADEVLQRALKEF